MAARGRPILGDFSYDAEEEEQAVVEAGMKRKRDDGEDEGNTNMKRLQVHAESLSFLRPVTLGRVAFIASCPYFLKATLKLTWPYEINR